MNVYVSQMLRVCGTIGFHAIHISSAKKVTVNTVYTLVNLDQLHFTSPRVTLRRQRLSVIGWYTSRPYY
jgi:hypothetical protein